MKAAAKAAGFTSARLGELLGREDGTVRGWWRGHSEPTHDQMLRYAELTSVSVAYLISGAEEAMGPVGTLAEWRLRFADLVAQGIDPAAALDQISGQPPPIEIDGIPLAELNDAEKLLMAGLNEAAGGDWSRLTDEQKEAILRLVETMAKGNSPPVDPAPPHEPDR